MSAVELKEPTFERQVTVAVTEMGSQACVAVIYNTGGTEQELKSKISQLVENGFSVLVFTTHVGEFTQWLSRSLIYYYLIPNRFGKRSLEFSTPLRSITDYIRDIANDLCGCRPSVVLCVGQGPVAFAARIAATLSYVPHVLHLSDPSDDARLTALAERFGVCGVDSIDSKSWLQPGKARALTPASRLRGRIAAALYLFIRNKGARAIYLFGRRLVEFFTAVVLALVAAPVFFSIALMRLFQGKPLVSRTLVQGKQDEPFELLSFAESDGTLPVGKLQWLPALLNVIEGELSFVGPRVMPRSPALPVATYWVNPGLTGWAQLKGGATATQEELVAMDELYIGTLSPILDTKLLALAVLKLVRLR